MTADRRALWLLSLVLCGGCSTAEIDPWLVDVTAEVGLDFRHEAGAAGRFLLPEIMGSGVALLDADGDGALDIYFVNGRKGDGDTNRFYRQQPDGRFADATAGSGLGDNGYGMGVAVGDIDNDGDPDLYLTNHGPDRLYRNRGDGTFEEITAAAGIEVDGWSASATFFDYDLDGLLDLYVTRYVDDDAGKSCMDRAGRPDYCQPQVFPALTDVLLHNEGGGRFADVSAAAGILGSKGPGLGVVADDFDGDGLPDLFVANDGAANLLWLNRGDGRFDERAVDWGAAYNLAGRPEAGMGIACADFDDNGLPDLFLTHLASETHTLYLNQGPPAGFTDATGQSGMAAPSRGATGFGTAALDLELDGDLDLVVANGRVTRGRPHARSSVPAPWNLFAEPNQVFLNSGKGLFASALAEVAPFVSVVEVSRGLAIGDVDRDGDVDILTSNTGTAARLYRNDAPRAGSWLHVRAVDPRYGRDAIGARVTLVTGATRRMVTIRSGFSYLSSSPPVAYFGIPTGVTAERIEVR